MVSGSCAAHSLLITTEGKLWSWGEYEPAERCGDSCSRAPAVLSSLLRSPRQGSISSSRVLIGLACTYGCVAPSTSLRGP